MQNKVSIEWESTGYSVLKNLNASVLGIFCEFIDNSLQSNRDKKDEILKIDSSYKLKIEINYDGDQISIIDNAGGINKRNFERALKPANRPDNFDGLNEFGLGMKYAAVWISNEWELVSSAIGEDVERRVVFNYNKVVTQNIKELPVEEKYADPNTHYTKVYLRNLEQKHVKPWRREYYISKLKSIYRNFLRDDNTFYDQFREDNIELLLFGEDHSNWKEYGFLNKPYFKEVQIEKNLNAKNLEWKFKFPWQSIPYEDEVLDSDGNLSKKTSDIGISGFVGILPDGEHKGRNGFVLFRRGRVVEGYDQRIYPIDISGKSARGFKYIRLYGELHFKNVDISFDKTKLSINRERREDIFSVIATMLKEVEIEGKKYNLLSQADKHRVKFNYVDSKKAIDNYKKTQNQEKSLEYKLRESLIANEKISDEDDLINVNEEEIIDDTQVSTHNLGTHNCVLKLRFHKRDNESFYSIEETNDMEEVNVYINLAHKFFQGGDFNKEPYFSTIINLVKCMVISELKGKISGGKINMFRTYFNKHLPLFIDE